MNMILHNIKVAVRNLMKYKLQTAISVLSIAVGIVTFSLAHSMMSRYRLPSILDQPYSDRIYEVSFKMIHDEKKSYVSDELIKALNGNGGLQNAEKLAVLTDLAIALYKSKFQLADSTVRTGFITAGVIDPELPEFIGIQSSISGKKIPKLKAGEAIIAEDLAKRIFGDINPIGASVELESLSSNPHTIAYVYKTTSFTDPLLLSDCLFYCNADKITDGFGEDSPYSESVEIVMKRTSTEKKLLKEINDRLLPLGIKAEISSIEDKYDFKKIIPIKMIVYAIGSLILLAAIIGFLRIEIQLFRLRKREIALRIVNGASLRQIFGCLFTEVTLTICIAVILALILGILLQDFMNEILKLQMAGSYIYKLLQDSNLLPYSMTTGMVLIMVCSLIAWCMILKISKEQEGLETSIRRKNNHVFPIIMLGIQIIICLVFVCSTFILVKGGDLILKACNVPDNDSHYEECLYIEFNKVSKREQLKEAIMGLPELEKLISYHQGMTVITEVLLNPKLSEQLNGRVGYNCYITMDTTFLSFLGIHVEWLRNDTNINNLSFGS